MNPYGQWTPAAAKKLLGVFAGRSVPARMRGERYSCIVFGDDTADRLSQLLNRELNELRTYFVEQRVGQAQLFRARALFGGSVYRSNSRCSMSVKRTSSRVPARRPPSWK